MTEKTEAEKALEKAKENFKEDADAFLACRSYTYYQLLCISAKNLLEASDRVGDEKRLKER